MLPLLSILAQTGEGSETAIGRGVEALLGMGGIEPTIGALLVFIVIAIWLRSVLTFTAMVQVGYASAVVARDMRIKLLRALMAVRWDYITGARAGDFSTAVGTEAGKVSTVYLQLCQMLASGIQIAVYLFLASLLLWWVTLPALALGLLTMVALARLVGIARNSGQAQNRIMRSLMSNLIDGLNMMKPVKAMGEEPQLLSRFEADVNGLNCAQRRNILSSQALQSLQEPILVLAIALGLFFLLDHWSSQFEALFGIVLLFNRTVTRLNALQRNYHVLARVEPAFSFVRTLTEGVEEEREVNNGRCVLALEREVRLKEVSFEYGQKVVLSRVSMVVPVRHFTAITGASGAGKTTIADIIIGLLRPNCGEVFIDDVPMGDVDLVKWRRRIGYVPQDTYLFHDTIYNNICLSDSTVTRKQVEQALRRAEAWSFISELPEGMETFVGERGQKLSGGQRQRISIARALVRKPDLIILDEATTSLDRRTEAEIIDTIKHLSKETAILWISHQPVVAQAASIVYQIKNHEVSEI